MGMATASTVFSNWTQRESIVALVAGWIEDLWNLTLMTFSMDLGYWLFSSRLLRFCRKVMVHWGRFLSRCAVCRVQPLITALTKTRVAVGLAFLAVQNLKSQLVSFHTFSETSTSIIPNETRFPQSRNSPKLLYSSCIQCPLGEVPNMALDACEPIKPVHLEWDSPWALVPALFSALGLLATAAVTIVFFRFNYTPVV